ncbi:MAG: ATP-binding protein [Patescibacteria group bacterium]
MTLIPRALTPIIVEKLKSSNKGIIVYGARQIGKTTLVNEVVQKLGLKTLVINGDQSQFLDILSSRNLNKIKSLVGDYQLVFIDEAQRIPEIGIALKIILDNLPSIKVLVTGSSSLDLASKISEPLTGRAWTYRLYPISFLELSENQSRAELDTSLEERLVLGAYPEIFSMAGSSQRREYLQNLADAYLYRDLLEFGEIKNSSKIRDLLKLLSFQIGSLVSLTEIGSQLGMGKETVSRYIDLLEKSNIVFRLKGLSRNLRKEIVKMDKVYFFDLGIRNILIDNLKPLKDRNDIGQLWENFLIVERMKLLAYTRNSGSIYFWRTYTGAELDYVEEKAGRLSGFEFKHGDKNGKVPASWVKTYPKAEYQCINRTNYLDFVLPETLANCLH